MLYSDSEKLRSKMNPVSQCAPVKTSVQLNLSDTSSLHRNEEIARQQHNATDDRISNLLPQEEQIQKD